MQYYYKRKNKKSKGFQDLVVFNKAKMEAFEEGAKTAYLTNEAEQIKIISKFFELDVNDASLDGKSTIKSITMDKDGIALYGWCAGEPADVHCHGGGASYVEYSKYLYFYLQTWWTFFQWCVYTFTLRLSPNFPSRSA